VSASTAAHERQGGHVNVGAFFDDLDEYLQSIITKS
jgi:hypothetical protein